MSLRLEVNTTHNTMLRYNPKREESLAYCLVARGSRLPLGWWSWPGLNRRPRECHSRALPTALQPHELIWEISEIPCETAVMLTWVSRDSQEKETGQARPFLVLAEPAVEDSSCSRCAIIDDLGLLLKNREKKRTTIELAITVLDKH